MINDSMNNKIYKYTSIQMSCVASATVWNMKYRYIAPTGEQLGYDGFGEMLSISIQGSLFAPTNRQKKYELQINLVHSLLRNPNYIQHTYLSTLQTSKRENLTYIYTYIYFSSIE